MRRRLLPMVLGALVSALPLARAAAQDTSGVARVRTMIAAADSSGARALVDSLLDRTPEESLMPELLFLRASVAETEADAERYDRRLVVEYPMSDRAGDALLALAQGEIARAERDIAITHLTRLVRDYPMRADRPLSTWWLARALLDGGDAPRGCLNLLRAQAMTPAAEAELRNQMAFYATRCVAVDTAAVLAAQQGEAAGQGSSVPTAGRGDPLPSPAIPRDSAATATQFTVQVAAYTTRADAATAAGRLRERGYTAWIASSGRYYRVRIGRYTTRAEAAALLSDLRARGMDGFVVVAGPEVRQ